MGCGCGKNKETKSNPAVRSSPANAPRPGCGEKLMKRSNKMNRLSHDYPAGKPMNQQEIENLVIRKQRSKLK